jgi:MFS family permease
MLGCKIVIIFGAFISSLCYIGMLMSPNIYLAILFYGFFNGVACGMLYLATIIAIPEYFEKKKGIATGITMAGSGKQIHLISIFFL